MSPAWASPTRGPLRGLIVISALWRCFSTARTTLVSNLLPRILRILTRPDSTSLRMAGVTSKCLPVYSTFMSAPPWVSICALPGHCSWNWWDFLLRLGVPSLRDSCLPTFCFPALPCRAFTCRRFRAIAHGLQDHCFYFYFFTLRWWVLGMRSEE